MTQPHRHTKRVRRFPDNEIGITIGDVEYIMPITEANELVGMINEVRHRDGFRTKGPVMTACSYCGARSKEYCKGGDDRGRCQFDEGARTMSGPHKPVTTLEELDALDDAELIAGHCSAEKGDPEPGANHTRSYHHGWRTRMMDLNEIEIPAEHHELTKLWCARERELRKRA